MVSNIQLFIFRATLLFLFAVSLFFVLFLANGYKYDFVSNQIRRTGIVEVAFEDNQAQVFMDGKKVDGNLPFMVSNILPGKYNLVVAREGFWDWSKQIVVTEDLISKIDDVLLYPLDEHSISKVLIDTSDLTSNYLLRDGYFFKIENKNLSYGKLSDGLTDSVLKKLSLPMADFPDIEVYANKALLTFADSKRYLLDLITGNLSFLSDNKTLVYAQDKWIYFKNNLLAVFDLNLTNVHFAKKFGSEEIVEVNYFSLEGKVYLLVKMKGQIGGTLYRYNNQNLLEIAENVVEAPLSDESGNLIVLTQHGELWRYDVLKEKKLLLARFSDQIDLLGFALNNKKTSGQLIWKEAGNWNVGDIGFSNVRLMFKHNQIIDLKLAQNGRIYYLERIQTDAPENSTRIRLMQMDLDI